MPSSSLVLIAIATAVAAGIAATLFLRHAGRRRMESAAGIQALATMRWREFSQFVVTALQAQGFEAAPLSDASEASQDSGDVLLRRDHRTWLLACRQSPGYRVTAKQVAEMGHAVRQRGAAGGVIATLGQVDRGLEHTAERVELLDGAALWELIAPLLPAGLQDHVAEQVQRRQRKATIAAWAGALLLGVVVAFVTVPFDDGEAAAPQATQTAAARNATPAAPGTEPPVAPVSGDDEATRQAVLDAVDVIEGVDRSVWSTRSTLLVQLETDTRDVRDDVCAVLERHEALRASRVQLQPPSGSTASVRFLQCRAY